MKARSIGTLLGLAVLLGIAGRERSAIHARETGRVLTAIDPEYCRGLAAAVAAGVEVVAYDVRIDFTGVSLNGRLSVRLSGN
mgnify:CR=1 FL=1